MTGMIGGSDKSVRRIAAMVSIFVKIQANGMTPYSTADIDALGFDSTKSELTQALTQLAYRLNEWRK